MTALLRPIPEPCSNEETSRSGRPRGVPGESHLLHRGQGAHRLDHLSGPRELLRAEQALFDEATQLRFVELILEREHAELLRVHRLRGPLQTVRAHFILYVRDQRSSAHFWSAALGTAPSLDVPGMTEFTLSNGAVLGLMPAAGIKRLLPALPDPESSSAPRAELYLVVSDAAAYHVRALAAGARELSPLELRSWGHRAAYSLDADGHVLAFAEEERG